MHTLVEGGREGEDSNTKYRNSQHGSGHEYTVLEVSSGLKAYFFESVSSQFTARVPAGRSSVVSGVRTENVVQRR